MLIWYNFLLYFLVWLLLNTLRYGFSLVPILNKIPRVIIYLLTGIILGASILDDVYSSVYPESWLITSRHLANLGIIFYCLHIGSSLNYHNIATSLPKISLFSLINVVLCFLSGLPFVFLTRDQPAFNPTGGLGAYMLSVASMISVSALPIMGNILEQYGLINNDLGQSSMAIVTLLSVIMCQLTSYSKFIAINAEIYYYFINIGTLLLLVLLLIGWHRVISQMTRHNEFINTLHICLAIGVSSLTEYLGYTVILGSVLYGLIVVRDAKYVSSIKYITDDLLLPLYLYQSGVSVNFRLIQSATEFGWMILFTVLSVLAKLLYFIPLKIGFNYSIYDNIFISGLLNCRGLFVIVIAGALRDSGAIGNSLYTAGIVMAVVTNIMTAPLVAILESKISVSQESPV